jgi:hypothetical protein
MGGGPAFLPVIDTVLSGYTIVVQSVRGTYDSGGKQILDDPYLTVEGPDGYDTVEWVAGEIVVSAHLFPLIVYPGVRRTSRNIENILSRCIIYV